MADLFCRVSAEGRIGPEAVVNVFWFREPSLVGDWLLSDLVAVRTAFVEQIAPALADVMHVSYNMSLVKVSGWKSTGFVSDVPPQQIDVDIDGAATGVLNGNGQCAIVGAGLGVLTSLVTTPGRIARAYWAIGPVIEGSVNPDGTFDPGVYSAWPDMLSALHADLTLIAVPFAFPIKVSQTSGGAQTDRVTAWRDCEDAFTRPYASFRRSRMNRK